MAEAHISYIAFKAAQDLLRYQRMHLQTAPLTGEEAFTAALRQLSHKLGMREVLAALPAPDPFAPESRPRAVAGLILSTAEAAREIMDLYCATAGEASPTIRLRAALQANPAATQTLEKIVAPFARPDPRDDYSPYLRAHQTVGMLGEISGGPRPS